MTSRERNPMKIAMVSEHASPLAALGGVDAGGLREEDLSGGEPLETLHRARPGGGEILRQPAAGRHPAICCGP